MLPCAGGAYSLPAQRQSFHYSLHCFAVLASCFAPKGIIIFRRLCCAATAVSVRARLLPCVCLMDCEKCLHNIHVFGYFASHKEAISQGNAVAVNLRRIKPDPCRNMVRVRRRVERRCYLALGVHTLYQPSVKVFIILFIVLPS